MQRAIIRLADMTPPKVNTVCRCCGKNLGLERFMDNHPIHTRCIPKHWSKHSHGVNASRCKEFGGK